MLLVLTMEDGNEVEVSSYMRPKEAEEHKMIFSVTQEEDKNVFELHNKEEFHDICCRCEIECYDEDEDDDEDDDEENDEDDDEEDDEYDDEDDDKDGGEDCEENDLTSADNPIDMLGELDFKYLGLNCSTLIFDA